MAVELLTKLTHSDKFDLEVLGESGTVIATDWRLLGGGDGSVRET